MAVSMVDEDGKWIGPTTTGYALIVIHEQRPLVLDYIAGASVVAFIEAEMTAGEVAFDSAKAGVGIPGLPLTNGVYVGKFKFEVTENSEARETDVELDLIDLRLATEEEWDHFADQEWWL